MRFVRGNRFTGPPLGQDALARLGVPGDAGGWVGDGLASFLTGIALGGFVARRVVDRLRNDPDALDPAAKTGNYLNNVLAIVEARERGADDAVLLNRNGRVTEGTTANVFIVKDDIVKTPPLRSGILGGITRGIVLELLEQAVKIPMFDCKDCGDCSLPDIAYQCPEGACAKNQRNGPCGGSLNGECEVPGKPCIWAVAYDRLRPYGEAMTMLESAPVIGDNALRGTSAWANTFLGRDHYGREDQARADEGGEA